MIEDTQKCLKAKNFIEEILIDQIGKLINDCYDYFAFILIAQGIEFLGSFFDKKGFEEYKQSNPRFKKALQELFENPFYKEEYNQECLFRHLRGNLIHQIRPSDKIILVSQYNSWCPVEKHLTEVNGKRILIIEQFYRDFKKACEKLVKLIEDSNPRIDPMKISSDFIILYQKSINKSPIATSAIAAAAEDEPNNIKS